MGNRTSDTPERRVERNHALDNYGTSDKLRAVGVSGDMESYLRFDLSGLAGLSVLQARLRLFVAGASDSGGSVYAISNGWTSSMASCAVTTCPGYRPISG